MIFKLPRKRWVALAVLGAALVVAVPVAWATFADVGPENQFYNDINAIQGAGITQGCGGGNFCPNDTIKRQAEAAFIHRAGGRAAYDLGGNIKSVSNTAADLAVVTVDVGGVAGQTQFVTLNGSATSFIESTTGCPCQTQYYIVQDSTLDSSQNAYTSNTFVGSSAVGLSTASVPAVFAVPSGTTQTFRLEAVKWDGTGTVDAFGTLSAVTTPFGSTGTATLQPAAHHATGAGGVTVNGK